MRGKDYRFLILITMLLSLQCVQSTGPVVPELKVTVEDVSCVEAWLRVELKGGVPVPTFFVLSRLSGGREEERDTVVLYRSDTVMVDEGLVPGKEYRYCVQWSGKEQTVQVRTMDTTSHEFSWQISTLGDGTGSSCLYDVAIINDTLAYAVGEIYQDYYKDYKIYNAAKWNGQKWKLMRIYFPTVCGSSSLSCYPAKSIFAFNDGEIWISSSGDKIAILKDGVQVDNFCLPSHVSMSINKLGGTSSRDLYAVGNNGMIAHYDGEKWERIESGTELPLNDIWGGSNKWLGENVVLIPASEKYTLSEKKLIRVQNGKVKDILPWPMQDRRIHSVWFNQGSAIFTSEGGVFRSKGRWVWEEMTFPPIYTNRIRGNDENDIVVVGDFGIAGHYNGVYWRVYNELTLNGNYESVDIKNNIFIAVGYNNRNATAVIGRRN